MSDSRNVSKPTVSDSRLSSISAPGQDRSESSWQGLLSRRSFLSYSALALAMGWTGCDSRGPAELGSSVPAGSLVDEEAWGNFELEEKTIDQLQQAMIDGALSAEKIVELYLARIKAMNRQGPELHAVIETNPDALDIARALDQERAERGPRGPLHGIPILLKDNIATHDKTTTTAGSLVLEGSIPPQDSFVAKQLRDAGAVLLGKANLSEWANFRSNFSSSGWSGRGRQCKNPYVLDRNPCGSSSGSGAAVSANFAAAAIGTETNGSIVCPSTVNGVVGIKPTVGLVSRS